MLPIPVFPVTMLLPFQGAVFVARALPRASLRFALGYALIGLSARALPMGIMEMALRGFATG